MEQKEEIRKHIITMPINSIIYMDIEDNKDKTKLMFEQIKIKSLDELFRSIVLKQIDHELDNNITWQDILADYQETFASYMATIYYHITEELGDDMTILLCDPIYQVGYDHIQEQIYIYKRCPLHIK